MCYSLHGHHYTMTFLSLVYIFTFSQHFAQTVSAANGSFSVSLLFLIAT